MEFYFPLFITRSFSIHSNFLRTGVRGLANFPNEFRSLDGRSGIAAPDVGIRFKAVQKVRDIWHACSQKSSPCSPQSATCTKKTCATLVSGALQPRLRIEIYLPAKTEGHQMAIFISKSKAIENKTTTRLHLSQPFNSQKKVEQPEKHVIVVILCGKFDAIWLLLQSATCPPLRDLRKKFTGTQYFPRKEDE